MLQTNTTKIKKAIDFASLSLAGKKRYSGEDFYEHCLKVAKKLEDLKIKDENTLVSAILHHSLSDGAATYNDIKQEFGEDIADLVKTVDSLRVIKLPEVSKVEFVESLRKMFLSLAKDLRAVLIKVCDILDNLRTLEYLPEEKRKEVSKETIEIFAPLVDRLGMGEVKGQMEDLVFPFINPQGFDRVSRILKVHREKLEKRLLRVKSKIQQVLDKESLPYRLEHRVKHIYSLYNKLSRPEINFDINLVYDLIAFRIITDSSEHCYQILGLVHKTWKPLPNYVRDYIANPKPNGYQSIHTTVFGPGDLPFEIQIRTEKMHSEAEYGVAAHWHYTQIKSSGANDKKLNTNIISPDRKLEWVKSLSSWQDEILDHEEYLSQIKTDFFGERIFVFTPKGDVKDLPKLSTPIDFAYSIHSQLGNLATGAKVNGKLVSLDSKLQNSDVCEILLKKDSNKKPSRDWLKFVVTSLAKKEIRKAYL